MFSRLTQKRFLGMNVGGSPIRLGVAVQLQNFKQRVRFIRNAAFYAVLRERSGDLGAYLLSVHRAINGAELPAQIPQFAVSAKALTEHRLVDLIFVTLSVK